MPHCILSNHLSGFPVLIGATPIARSALDNGWWHSCSAGMFSDRILSRFSFTLEFGGFCWSQLHHISVMESPPALSTLTVAGNWCVDYSGACGWCADRGTVCGPKV